MDETNRKTISQLEVDGGTAFKVLGKTIIALRINSIYNTYLVRNHLKPPGLQPRVV